MSRNVIVCVDDEKIILDSLREQIVARFGQDFDVEVGEGGEEGLEIIEELVADGKQLALVISDHLMPGMKGDEFLIRVHKEHPESLKILLTGQASLESVGKAINHARIYRYVVKPWDEEDLMLTVEKALNSFLQYLQLQEYNRLLVSLNSAIQEISSEVNLESVINRVLASTLESTKAEKGFLLVHQDGKLEVSGVSSIRKDEEERIRQQIQHNREPLTQELMEKIGEALNSDGRQTALVSPINKKGRNLGYVYLENPYSREVFSNNQRQILQMLASQAAISLDNAGLYNKLEDRNTELERINVIIREKNDDITNSIRYAKRIQEAILPSVDTLKPFLPKSSLFFKPKDIVSGDFYWWIDKSDQFMLAIADCTGHGVPGGFMSVLSNTMLNEAVNVYGLTDANAILQFISIQMREILKQDEQSITKDGMDIGLLVIDADKKHMQYSGARRPLWRVRNNLLEVVNADKLSIGELPEDGQGIPVYTNHDIDLEPGDTFYLFTDGIVDQFGGGDHRRFNRKRLAELVAQMQHLPVNQQANFIQGTIETWMGDFEQTDDMLLLALQF